MLRLYKLAKFFGERTVFCDLNLIVGQGARIGIVGPNGCGKSTLLKVIGGLIEADEGSVEFAGDVSVAYLEQAEPVEVAELPASGGEKQIAKLENVFRRDADVLLLDEPTNNLDAEEIEKLIARLEQMNSVTMIVVSHDRYFLDAMVDRIIEINPITGECTHYGGNYSSYEQLKSDAAERTMRMYTMQQRKVEQLQQDIRATKQQACKVENSTVHDFWRGRAKKVAAKAKARETRLKKILSAENVIEKPRAPERIRLELAQSRLRGKTIIECRDLIYNWQNQRQLVVPTTLQIAAGEHVVITGENGGGKSTLLRLLIGELQPHEGTIWRMRKAAIAVLRQSDSHLPHAERMIDWFVENCGARFSNDASVRTYLHRFLFAGSQVFQPIQTLSSGERLRLQLAAIMASEPDVIFLDEPTNHMDIQSIKRIEEALSQFNGTLIVVTHDRAFRENLRPHQHWHIHDGNVFLS